MSWALDHVAVPANDLRASVAFYREVVGLRETVAPLAPGYVARGDIARFVSPVAGELHLAKPDPGIARRRGSFIDPLLRGHAGIRVADIDRVAAELTSRGTYFADESVWPIEGYRRIYVLDPSLNCVEVNDRAGSPADAQTDLAWKLEHIFTPAHDVRTSAAFYSEVIGMTEVVFPAKRSGRGSFSLDPADLAYFPDEGRSHVDVLRPSGSFARDNHLHINPLAVPHFAIEVPDIAPVKQRLDHAGIFYGDAGHFALQGLYQLYLYDPSMNLIEICQRLS